MAHLTREQILGAEDIVTETVPVPEWGAALGFDDPQEAEVGIKTLDAEEYLDMGFDLRDLEDEDRMKTTFPLLVAAGCIDEDGNQLFQPDDAKLLAKKSFGPISRIATRIMEISGLTDESEGEGDEGKN